MRRVGLDFSQISLNPKTFLSSRTIRHDGVVFNHREDDEFSIGGNETATPTFEELIQQLNDTEPDIRADAAFSLGLLKDKRAVDPLIKCLSDDNEEVRAIAAFMLGELKDPRAIEPLITTCLNDPSDEVRTSAALSLVLLKDLRAVKPLIKCLSDLSDEVRKSAASSLGWLNDISAIEPLKSLVRDLYKSGTPIENQSPICRQALLSIYRIDEKAISDFNLTFSDKLWLSFNKNEEGSALEDTFKS